MFKKGAGRGRIFKIKKQNNPSRPRQLHNVTYSPRPSYSSASHFDFMILANAEFLINKI